MKNILNHGKLYFRNISRCFFFNNAWVGSIFLALLLGFNWLFFLCGFAASLLGYIATVWFPTPKILKDCGTVTINGLFFGVTMASLFQKNVPFYFCLFLGALSLPLITKAIHEVLQHWKLNPLVIPYILMTWIFTLIANRNGFGLQKVWWNEANQIPTFDLSTSLGLQILDSLGRSMGGLFFLPHSLFGLSLVLLIAAFSLRRGWFYLIGTSVGLSVSFILSDRIPATFLDGNGLVFSTGLVGLGLASLPEKLKWRTILVFCLFSSILTIATEQLLLGLSLPILTLPFVLTFWLAVLSRVPKLNISWAPLTPKMSQLSILKELDVK